MPKYFTVVYEVHDEEKFSAVASTASGGMLSSAERIAQCGFDVNGCGWGDAMTRADAHAALSDYSDEEAVEYLLHQEGDDLSGEGVKLRIKEILG